MYQLYSDIVYPFFCRYMYLALGVCLLADRAVTYVRLLLWCYLLCIVGTQGRSLG